MRGRVPKTRRQKQRDFAARLPNLAAYTGKPCVYVRWLEHLQKYYIGFSKNLKKRYSYSELSQIVYFEEYSTVRKALRREKELIREFCAARLALVNLQHMF